NTGHSQPGYTFYRITGQNWSRARVALTLCAPAQSEREDLLQHAMSFLRDVLKRISIEVTFLRPLHELRLGHPGLLLGRFERRLGCVEGILHGLPQVSDVLPHQNIFVIEEFVILE